MSGEQKAQGEGVMRGANWVRVYHAYFQAMVVEGLTNLAARAMGVDTAFNMVAQIIASGSYRGFGILMEELAKEGVDVKELSLEELLKYEVRCHKYAVEKMGVPFQVFEEAGAEIPGKRYYLYTKNCLYKDMMGKNPVTCAVCVGLTTGILRRFGFKVTWVRTPERAKMLCSAAPDRRPEWIVYRDPNVKPPECKLVIEKLECG